MINAVSRIEAVRDGLSRIGYSADNIESEYLFTVRNGHAKTYRADLVAFADTKKHDLETACVVADVVEHPSESRERLELLRILATPFAFMLEPEHVSIWPVGPTLPRHPAEEVPYQDLPQYLSRREDLFSASSALRAKQAGMQLNIFSIAPGLLQYARKVTRTVLVDQFRLALIPAGHELGSRDPALQTVLTRYAVRVLAAAVLEDKEALGSGRAESAIALLQKARTRFGAFFSDSDYRRLGEPIAERLLNDLREGVTFRSFASEDLGHFYEYALSDEKKRRALGIYYTPHTIAKRILDALPIEKLAPGRRSVFDGTCGSGSLLLAAYKRLADLLPAGSGTDARHSYLVRMIEGLDKDDFATDLTKLALFLTDLPAGDGWRVNTGDFQDREIRKGGYGIVVANPPFIFDRGQAQANQELANRMLSRYLDCMADDGLLGIIMPESFAVSNAGRDARKKLLNTCKVIELWHLPERVFADSATATVVVLAERRTQVGSEAVRVIRVGPLKQAREAFEHRGEPEVVFVEDAKTWMADGEHRLTNSPVSPALTQLEKAPMLRQVADSANGIIPGGRANLARVASAGFRPWLDGAKRIRPFHVSWNEQDIRYIEWPGKLRWPRTQLRAIFETPNAKVLVNANRNSASPWRISAAIDRVGLFPSQGVHLIYPKKDEISLEELAAILNSSVANAWLDSRTRMRWINQQVLEDLPMPRLTEAQRKEIIRLVQEAEAAPLFQFDSLFGPIDDLITAGYGLDLEARKFLRDFMYKSGRGPFSKPTPEDDRLPMLSVSGHVLAVSAGDRSVRLWIRGITSDDGTVVPIPPGMPGWALEQGVSFQAEMPRGNGMDVANFPSRLSKFKAVDFAYLSDEQLDRVITSSEARGSLYLPTGGDSID